MPSKITSVALAILVLGTISACQNSTPAVAQPSPISPAGPAVQPTVSATATVVIPTPTGTPPAAATPTPAQRPVSTATTTLAPSPGPTSASNASLDGPAVFIGDVRFGTEIANTPGLRTRGLSGRQTLPSQTGMLFIFENGKTSNFWMKDMQFPLDFVWIGEDCTVVSVTLNVPHPETPDPPLPLYTSGPPAAFNFEINGGEVEALGLAIGDDVRFNGIEVPRAHC